MIYSLIIISLYSILLLATISITKLINYKNEHQKYKKNIKALVSVYTLFISILILLQHLVFKESTANFFNNDIKCFSQTILASVAIIISSIISIKINKPPAYLIVLCFFIIFMVYNVVGFCINNIYQLSFSRILYLIITILGILYILYNINMYRSVYIEFDNLKKKNKNKQSIDYKESVKITNKESTKTRMVE